MPKSIYGLTQKLKNNEKVIDESDSRNRAINCGFRQHKCKSPQRKCQREDNRLQAGQKQCRC